MMNRKSDTDKYYSHTIYYTYIVLTFAPLESKNSTTSVWPPLSALYSGMSPPYKHNQQIITGQHYTVYYVIGFWKTY